MIGCRMRAGGRPSSYPGIGSPAIAACNAEFPISFTPDFPGPRQAAVVRWAQKPAITNAADAPEAVRRLLKTYDPSALVWTRPDDRYAIVCEILVRGDMARPSVGSARSCLEKESVNSYANTAAPVAVSPHAGSYVRSWT